MVYLQHNHNTSLKTLGNILSDEIGKISNLYNVSHIENLLNKDKRVAIIDNNEMDINSYISYLNNQNGIDTLPKIIILRSNTIKIENMTQQNFNQVERLELVNKDDDTDKIFLEGVYFDYEVDIQIGILTRNNYASVDLQLELKRIIYEKLKKVNYSLQIFSDDTPNDFYRTDDFGSIALYGFENAQFDKQSDDTTGFNVMFMSGSMQESYFKLKSANVYTKMVLNGIISK